MFIYEVKKRLRFQTKLMLTLVAAITAVTVALIAVTETKVTQAYTQQFSRDFNHLVSQLERSRLERSQDFMELCNRLATHPYIIAAVRGTATEDQRRAFWDFYLNTLDDLGDTIENRPDDPVKRGKPPAEIINRNGSNWLTRAFAEPTREHPAGNGRVSFIVLPLFARAMLPMDYGSSSH